MRRKLDKDKMQQQSDTTGLIIMVAMLIGVVPIMISAYFGSIGHGGDGGQHVTSEILKEFGIVLAAVFGVSLLYERFLADRHFEIFYNKLQNIIGRGQSNAAACEALGIIHIFKNRRELEERNSFAIILNRLSEDDYYRVLGRSLIFTIYAWANFKPMLKNGAKLELCMIKPRTNKDWLSSLAGYSALETDFVVQRIKDSIIPWLESELPKGSVFIRFHEFPLLDSVSEVKDGGEYRIVWDVNFGEGLEARQMFFLDGLGTLGKHMKTSRYDAIWQNAEEVFTYTDRQVKINTL